MRKWIDNKFGHNASMVQSRLKEIAKMKPGGELHIPMPDPLGTSAVRFKLPVPEPLANPLVHLKDVAFGYPGAAKKLFKACSLRQ